MYLFKKWLHALSNSTLDHWTLRSWPLQYTHHTKQEHSSDYLFSDLRAISFLLFLLLFFYDDAMRGTTTQGQRPPRQRHVDNTTSHPTTKKRRATHDMTRHHTTKKRHTRTRTCTCICMCICKCRCSCTCRCHFLLISWKKSSLQHVPSMMCTVPSPWPSTMVESSLPSDKVWTWQTTRAKLYE